MQKTTFGTYQGLAIHLGPNEVQNECLEYMTVPQGAAGTLATSALLLLLMFLLKDHTHPGTPWPKSDLRITKIYRTITQRRVVHCTIIRK